MFVLIFLILIILTVLSILMFIEIEKVLDIMLDIANDIAYLKRRGRK